MDVRPDMALHHNQYQEYRKGPIASLMASMPIMMQMTRRCHPEWFDPKEGKRKPKVLLAGACAGNGTVGVFNQLLKRLNGKGVIIDHDETNVERLRGEQPIAGVIHGGIEDMDQVLSGEFRTDLDVVLMDYTMNFLNKEQIGKLGRAAARVLDDEGVVLATTDMSTGFFLFDIIEQRLIKRANRGAARGNVVNILKVMTEKTGLKCVGRAVAGKQEILAFARNEAKFEEFKGQPWYWEQEVINNRWKEWMHGRESGSGRPVIGMRGRESRGFL